ncbi:VOC family protein [Miniimonas arenae]|uniref:VOC family protein n=1 Tax=Miniimonas arenae TaxID=676201 RepID=A0A5C5BA32_9MICO|nr:VOC family protein [Miniimonas arenae]TNU72855.1 VOC family protein [Miniimonas arenae]
MSFNAYLFFGRTCREAFTFYRDVFGGELDLVTAADMTGVPPGIDPAAIMHASLTTPHGQLVGSDDPFADPFGPVSGMRVCATLPDADAARAAFDALADGGEVHQPFAATEWSAGFGMLLDRFGTPWMIDTAIGA